MSRRALFNSSFPRIRHPGGDFCVHPFATSIADHSGSWWQVRSGAGCRLGFHSRLGLGCSLCRDRTISSLLGLSLRDISCHAACGRVLRIGRAKSGRTTEYRSQYSVSAYSSELLEVGSERNAYVESSAVVSGTVLEGTGAAGACNPSIASRTAVEGSGDAGREVWRAPDIW